MNKFVKVFFFMAIMLAITQSVSAAKQITFDSKNHELDNNDNFSPDGNWLCYNTRKSTDTPFVLIWSGNSKIIVYNRKMKDKSGQFTQIFVLKLQ